MKKFLFLSFSLLAVALLTACGSDGAPINKLTDSFTTNTRAIDGDNIVFSQNTVSIELNLTDMLFKFSNTYLDADKRPHTISTPEMRMTHAGGTVYSFSNTGATADESLTGYIDIATRALWYTNGPTMVCTSQPQYPYATTTVSVPSNGMSYNQENSAYLFAINADGKSCTFGITNFAPNTAGSIEASLIEYRDIDVTPTATGYIITADEAQSNYSGHYTITDLNINLSSQCQVINGSFKCKDLEFSITGKMFPIANFAQPY